MAAGAVTHAFSVCRINRKRWGSVAFGMSAILREKIPVRRCWNLGKYLRGYHDYSEIRINEGQAAKGPKLTLIDESLTTGDWWGRIVTGDVIMAVIRDAFEWLEMCPCHQNCDWENASVEQKKRWMTCWMRGLRLPEVSAGELIDLFVRHPQELVVCRGGRRT